MTPNFFALSFMLLGLIEAAHVTYRDIQGNAKLFILAPVIAGGMYVLSHHWAWGGAYALIMFAYHILAKAITDHYQVRHIHLMYVAICVMFALFFNVTPIPPPR